MSDNKHLDYLQAAIGRMAGQSFLIKGWAVTLAAAALGLAVKEGTTFALIGLLPVAIFWLLDAYFLALEHGFRHLFREAVERDNRGEAPTFDMTPAHARPLAILRCAARPVVFLVHAPLVVTLASAPRFL
jgi:hypothetical protein